VGTVRGHPSFSLPLLSYPLLSSPSAPLNSPCSYVYFPHPCNISVPSSGTIPKADDFHTRRSDDVDSPEVINFPLLPPLIPQQHWMCLRCIGTGPCDTMVPSAITWIPIYGRLGTRRLGTAILCISFVV
jgi:hypothetical protein